MKKLITLFVILSLSVILSGCTMKESNEISSTNDQSSTEEESRDGQRYEDIAEVYNAVQDYRSANKNKAPATNEYSILSTYLVPDFIEQMPQDPVLPNNYYYVVSEDGYSFALGAWFEGSTDPYTQSLLNDAEDIMNSETSPTYVSLMNKMGGYPF